jgi:hypothetical protein
VFHYFTIKFHFSFFAYFRFKFFASLHLSKFRFEAKQSEAKFKSIFRILFALNFSLRFKLVIFASGAAWLNRVRHGLEGAAWLSRVRHGSVGCGMAQLVARRLAVRQARVRIPTWHPREVSATELFSDEGMERSLGECLWM